MGAGSIFKRVGDTVFGGGNDPAEGGGQLLGWGQLLLEYFL